MANPADASLCMCSETVRQGRADRVDEAGDAELTFAPGDENRDGPGPRERGDAVTGVAAADQRALQQSGIRRSRSSAGANPDSTLELTHLASPASRGRDGG